MRNGISLTKLKKIACGIKFSLQCQANAAQQAFIEEITRYNYESEIARRNGTSYKVKGFFDEAVTA